MIRGAKIWALVVGILVALVAAQGATAETDWRGVPTKTIPAARRSALRKALATAMDSIPAPPAPYALRPKESTFEVDAKAPWDRKTAKWWDPARAAAERYYEVPADAAGLTEERRNLLGPIEVRVELNGELKIGDLGSEGGAQTLFPIPDAVAVEVTTIAPGEAGGRVAAMTPEQADYRLTALTVVLGDELLEASARRLGREVPGEQWGGVSVWTADPAEVRHVFVRIHGPKKPVEDFARRIPTAALRRLLRG